MDKKYFINNILPWILFTIGICITIIVCPNCSTVIDDAPTKSDSGLEELDGSSDAGEEETDTQDTSDTEEDTDPCKGVLCEVPPPDECSSEENLIEYEDVGICLQGECHYPSQESICTHGCKVNINESDTCLDACEDMECNTPPAPECVENGKLKEFSNNGVCIDSTCYYSEYIIECQWGCLIVQDEPDECLPPVCLQNQEKCEKNIIYYCDEGNWIEFHDCSEDNEVCYQANPGEWLCQ